MPTKTYFARATLKRAETTTTVGRTKALWDLKIDLFGTYACNPQYAHDFVAPQLPEHGLLADRETAQPASTRSCWTTTSSPTFPRRYQKLR